MSSNLSVSASGSATGNPRNKVALKPGFSLVGWIRLTNSGEDLTGTNGRRFSVSKEELAKHSTEKDCWLAIRGKVYNITRYLEYHPGGVSELMRGAGKDATSLFDEVHPWVNIEQLLTKCYIGPLKTLATIELNPFALLPPLPSITENVSTDFKLPTRIIPRFDWIQKKGDLMIYFYLKGLCNPGLSLKRICDKECEATIFIQNDSHTYKFSFLRSLHFPPKVFINQESGKIEMAFKKEVDEVWSNFGVFEKIKTSNDVEEELSYNECDIVHREFINHDTFEIILRPKDEKIFIPSIGYHMNFKLESTIRSYTPVPSSYLIGESSQSFDLKFLIKKYNSGLMSKFLAETNDIVNISQQKGSLDLHRLKDHTSFLLLAAGSGLTPFCYLIDHLLARNNSKITNINLLYFNKTEADIWCRKQFEEIASKDKRFLITNVLSDAAAGWEGETGRVRKELCEEFLKDETVFVLICGNSGFNLQCLQILKEYKNVEMHCFDG